MFRTNFDKADVELYLRAIYEFNSQTGTDRLIIETEAFDSNGKIIPDAMSLHDTDGSNDLDLFWIILNRIKNKFRDSPSIKAKMVAFLNCIPDVSVLTMSPSIFSIESSDYDCNTCPASKDNSSDTYDEGICRDCWTRAILGSE